MSSEPEAQLFYGYKITSSDSDDINEKELKELCDAAGITYEDFRDNEKAVVGKKIEDAETETAQKITAAELLKRITSVEESEALKILENELNLVKTRPNLILLSTEET